MCYRQLSMDSNPQPRLLLTQDYKFLKTCELYKLLSRNVTILDSSKEQIHVFGDLFLISNE